MSGDPKEGYRALLKVAAVFCVVMGVIQAIAQVVALLLVIAGVVAAIAAIAWVAVWLVRQIRGPPGRGRG